VGEGWVGEGWVRDEIITSFNIYISHIQNFTLKINIYFPCKHFYIENKAPESSIDMYNNDVGKKSSINL
jgi:hypothetical protein